MRKLHPFLMILAGVLCGPFLPAQVSEADTVVAEPFSLFEFFHHQKDSLPLLQLDTDWGLLIRNKMKEEYQPAVLSFKDNEGSMTGLDVKIRARGNIRKEVCFYPPLKVKIKKRQLNALGFNSINDLKLVLPCKRGNAYKECLAREALAYRLYEIIHPVHIKTRVVRLECSEGGQQDQSLIAFLIEDEEEFTERLGAKIIDRGVVRASSFDRDSYLKMCFFQYMIANVDWSVANRHNLEVIALPGHERVVVVPYDFDYAGFSDTNYAVPAPSLPIKSVKQRYFMGRGITEEEALNTSKFFLSKKEEILRQCASFTPMDEKEVESIHRYLLKFFDLLEDEKKVARTFVTMD